MGTSNAIERSEALTLGRYLKSKKGTIAWALMAYSIPLVLVSMLSHQFSIYENRLFILALLPIFVALYLLFDFLRDRYL